MSQVIFDADITVPPSANALFIITSKRQRVKSSAYRKWIDLHEPTLRQMRRYDIGKEPVMVEVRANINRQRDLDNIIKPIDDLLVKCQIIHDDRYIDVNYAKRVNEHNSDVERDWARVIVRVKDQLNLIEIPKED